MKIFSRLNERMKAARKARRLKRAKLVQLAPEENLGYLKYMLATHLTPTRGENFYQPARHNQRQNRKHWRQNPHKRPR